MVDEVQSNKDVPDSAESLADSRLDSTESTDKRHQDASLRWLKEYELEDFDIVNTVEDLAMTTKGYSAAVADFLQQPPPPPPPPCIEVQTDLTTDDEMKTYTSVPILLRSIFMGEAPDEEKMAVLHKFDEIQSVWLNGCSPIKDRAEDLQIVSVSTQVSHHPFSVESMDCRWSATPDIIIEYLLERSGLETHLPPPTNRHDLDMVVYFYDSDPSKCERAIKLLKLFNNIHTAILPIRTKSHNVDKSSEEARHSCQETLQATGVRFLHLDDDKIWTDRVIQQDETRVLDVDDILNADQHCLQDLIMAAHALSVPTEDAPDQNTTPDVDLTPPTPPRTTQVQTLLVTDLEAESLRSLKSSILLLFTILSIITFWAGWIEQEEMITDELSVKLLNLSMDMSVPYFQAKLNPMWTTLDPVDHTHYFVVELYDQNGQRLPTEIGQEEVVDAVIRKRTRVSGDLIEEYEVINVPHLERGLYGVEVTSPCYVDGVEEIQVELWLSEYDIQVDDSPVTLSKEMCVNGRHGAGTRATEPRVGLKQALRSSQPRPSNPDGTSGGHILFSTKTKSIATMTRANLFQKWFRAIDHFLSSIMDYFTRATLPTYRFLPTPTKTDKD
ncbi:hypothetical protein Unana1_00322 [Umbelopsis nana]